MIFLDGFLTGLILQIAIGPVFFYILNLTLQRSLIDGYFAILAAVLVDYLYITLAVLGVGKADRAEKIQTSSGSDQFNCAGYLWRFDDPISRSRISAR